MVAIEKCMALYRHFKHVSKDCPECPLPDLEGPLSTLHMMTKNAVVSSTLTHYHIYGKVSCRTI